MVESGNVEPEEEPQDPLAAGRYYLAHIRGLHKPDQLRTAETVEDWAVRGLSPGSPENLATLLAQQRDPEPPPPRVSRAAQRRLLAVTDDTPELGVA